MAKLSMGYEHFVPFVKERPEYPSANTHILVRTIEELKSYLKDENKFMAVDTEATSLNPEEGFLVGYSFSFDGKTGYYVPVKHHNYGLGKESLDILVEFMRTRKMNFLFNVRFDFRYIESAGYNLEGVPYFDVSCPCWLADTNVAMPSLKISEKRFLGWCPDTFEQTLGDNYNFYYLDPEEVYAYACTDAEGTYSLVGPTLKYYKEARMSGQLDNECLFPLMRYENKPLPVDVELLQHFLDEENENLRKYEESIYQMVGYPFKLNSNKQLGDALQSLGINTGSFTAKGQMKVDINTLESYNIDNPHPIVELLVKYSKTNKMINSYLSSTLTQAQNNNNQLRFAYLTNKVPCLTKNNYVNIKGKGIISISKVEEGDYIATQYGWKRVIWKHKKWSSVIYRTHFSNLQYLEGTGHHPVLISNTGDWESLGLEWVALQSLDNDCVIGNAHFQSTHRCNHNKSILKGNIKKDKINKALLESNETVWIRYIAKLIKKSFTVEDSGNSLQFTTKDITFAKRISLLLGFLGIGVQYTISESKLITLKIEKLRDLHLLNTLCNEIESNDKMKYLNLNEEDIFFDGVMLHSEETEILDKGDYVYDIEVEDVHEYICNGIVTHNTGRLACGGDKKNTYFAKLNIQSAPKPTPKDWYVHKFNPDTDTLEDGEVEVLGWKFSLTNKSDYIVEGFNPESNFRRAFPAEKDSYWVSIDYCISPDSLIEKEDGSLVQIKELENTSFKIKTPNGYKYAYNFRYTGKKKKCILKLKDGKSVICSPDHRFKLIREDKELWLPLKEIELSDYIITD